MICRGVYRLLRKRKFRNSKESRRVPAGVSVPAILTAVILILPVTGKAWQSRADSGVWQQRVDSAQAALAGHFWDSSRGIFFSNSDSTKPGYNYWWQAHAMDALVLGYNRTGDPSYAQKIALMNRYLLSRYPGLKRPYFDDMEWMGLALLRAYEATGAVRYADQAKSLWKIVRTGWSDQPGGGGIRWRTKGIYKNVPANAPACILACKLYEDFHDTTDLEWAKKIFAWVNTNLVDHLTGIILDGISFKDGVGTTSHGSYSYNYGTYIGACDHLYRITGEKTYLNYACSEATAAVKIFSGSDDGILRSEGTGDGGLFNGIFVYYLARLVHGAGIPETQRRKFEDFILTNAKTLWRAGRMTGDAVFNDDWQRPPSGSVTLSTDLSGVTVLEAAAMLQR